MTPLLRFIHRFWIVITLLILFTITFLSLSPLAALPAVPGTDKTHHFVAYAALMFSVALRKPKYWLLWALFFACWSGGIELLQPYVNRHGEWWDFAANVGGLICGAILASVINRIFPLAPTNRKSIP
ncbi:VanZ family protein [Photobacterium sp. SDRW27]|uniref:VanZ family protein n=1 Tax=Photobacterium obscurum TaxID=2829490 RepID=UPI002244BAC7|nr:VanZ family protein [Photobacterium obscurum]MCW8327698.1 VanZ family protein [Photobacterium obscurum]